MTQCDYNWVCINGSPLPSFITSQAEMGKGEGILLFIFIVNIAFLLYIILDSLKKEENK